MKSPIIGYIVLEQDGGVFCAVNYGSPEEQKILWRGNGATLFRNRYIAKLFLRRTIKYAAKRGFDWRWLDTAFVVPVRKGS